MVEQSAAQAAGADGQTNRPPGALLRHVGTASWFALGIIAVAVVLAAALGAVSGIFAWFISFDFGF